MPGWAPPGDTPLVSAVYFRALVNFTRSIHYSPRLEDASSEEFREVSEALVDTVRRRGLGAPRGGGRAWDGVKASGG